MRETLETSRRKVLQTAGCLLAWADTVLFPALHRIFSAKEYDALGDAFEDKERELFGEGGFEKRVERVAAIEKSLGLSDLSQFTAKG